MTYGDFKDLTRRTASDKVLRDKYLILLKVLNMMDIKEVLLQCFIDFLIKDLLCLQINMLLVVVLEMRICPTSN